VAALGGQRRSDDETIWSRHWGLIRVLISAGFAFSCFGLLLFVWITFGGPIPLAPTSYRITADFPEAITLQKESDVRISGVSVGKVKGVELAPTGNTTRATIELNPDFAPLSSDAKAILRQKTLLGETYVELTPGTGQASSGDPSLAAAGGYDSLAGDDASSPIPEGGHLADSQIAEQTQIDEVFNGFDEQTRNAFRVWQQDLAIGAKGRGLDLSDAFGNLGPFSQEASRVLATLNRQGDALSQVVSSTGQVFAALTERDNQLGTLIKGNDETFGALASRDKQLAETVKILPTFNEEARKTLVRLESFTRNAQPLARDLKPVARNLTPTLKDLRRFAPHARTLFQNLDPLLTAAQTGFPALRGTVRDLNPVVTALDPFLANLNPIIRYTGLYSGNVTDFLADTETTMAGTLNPQPGEPSAMHAFRQIAYISPESLSIYPTRLSTNRGNGYNPPSRLGDGIGPAAAFAQQIRNYSHDCDNTGATGGLGSGQVTIDPPSTPPSSAGLFPLGALAAGLPGISANPSCVIAPAFPAEYGGTNVPQVFADP
jgi:phospholipid/cholesterol/gamma-HCH transport system substrate-binding protein